MPLNQNVKNDPPDNKSFNIDDLLLKTNNDRILVKEVMELYEKQIFSILTKINNDEIDKLGEYWLHTLKGASSSVGFHTIAEKANYIECIQKKYQHTNQMEEYLKLGKMIKDALSTIDYIKSTL